MIITAPLSAQNSRSDTTEHKCWPPRQSPALLPKHIWTSIITSITGPSPAASSRGASPRASRLYTAMQHRRRESARITARDVLLINTPDHTSDALHGISADSQYWQLSVITRRSLETHQGVPQDNTTSEPRTGPALSMTQTHLLTRLHPTQTSANTHFHHAHYSHPSFACSHRIICENDSCIFDS